MSSRGEDPARILGSLDFEADSGWRGGPQTFADEYGQARRSDRVFGVSTFRGTADPMRNFVVVGEVGSATLRNAVEIIEGRVVVVTNPELTVAKVLNITGVPCRHSPGSVVVALLRRGAIRSPFTVVSRHEETLEQGNVFVEQLRHRDLAKWAICNTVGAHLSESQRRLGQMSEEQRAEFTLFADVLAALGN